MNPIKKYRVWDAKAKQMMFPLGIAFVNRDWFYVNHDIRDVMTVYSDDPDVMEFTGLKDIYGQEIYDGDIMNFNGFTFKLSEIKSFNFEVKWDIDQGAWIGYTPTYNDVLGNFVLDAIVVGNRYDK